MRRLPTMVELVLGLATLAHAVLAFTKWRWVTGLLELAAGAALVLASRAPHATHAAHDAPVSSPAAGTPRV